METVFQEQIHRLEQQLRRYTQAYESQRELLHELQSKLQLQQEQQNGRIPDDRCISIRTSMLPHEASTVAPPSQEYSVTQSSFHEDNEFQQHFAQALQQRAAPTPEVNRFSPGRSISPQRVLPGNLSESLAAASSDAARYFVASMRRLWASYFAHMRGEVRGFLEKSDDAFRAFDTHPREDTLADLLEIHQRLRPTLTALFGTLDETVESERSGGLPPGNPLMDESAIVRHLSLSVAEAVTPVLAVALRNHSHVTPRASDKEPNVTDDINRNRAREGERKAAVEAWWRHRHGGDAEMDSRGQYVSRDMRDGPEVKRLDLSPQPEKSNGTLLERMERYDHIARETTEDKTEKPTEKEEDKQRHTFHEERTDETPVKSNASDGHSISVPPHSIERAAMTCSEPYSVAHSPVRARSLTAVRRQTNDSGQIECILYGGRLHSRSNSRSASVAPERRLSTQAAREQNRTNPGSPKSGYDKNTKNNNNNNNHNSDGSNKDYDNYYNDDDEGGLEGGSNDPHLRLRYLKRLEEKAVFQVLNNTVLRGEHGSEAKYYALNKRLARIRSEVKRTESEVAELDRIEAVREALRREREEYNMRRFRR